jgi:hypothetical protein
MRVRGITWPIAVSSASRAVRVPGNLSFIRSDAPVRGVPDHIPENNKVFSDPFIHSSQTFPYVESRSIISEQDFSMAGYKIGDTVKKAKGGTGVIRAIFTTLDGGECYAVENEGALEFVEEASLSPVLRVDLAAA